MARGSHVEEIGLFLAYISEPISRRKKLTGNRKLQENYTYDDIIYYTQWILRYPRPRILDVCRFPPETYLDYQLY